MGYKIGQSLESCAKSHLALTDEHAQLAKHHGKLANKTAGDDHREIAKCHERIADHHADLANEFTQAAKAQGGVDTHDDSSGIHELAEAAGAGPGKFGMLKAMEDDQIRSRVIPPQKSDTPDLSKVPAEFADLLKLD